jgi:hypothetical protein
LKETSLYLLSLWFGKTIEERLDGLLTVSIPAPNLDVVVTAEVVPDDM